MNNKKGMFDDLLDLLFTVMAAFFMLLFINVAFDVNAAHNEKDILATIGQFQSLDDSQTYWRLAFEQGENINYDTIALIFSKSKILQGKLISACGDYSQEIDCKKDPVQIYSSAEEFSCQWVENKCTPKVKAGVKK